ncbi:MAG: hypothetical protein CVU43_17580 [Chloroflexi bacterium HGW-Chloroflexi-5]|jgi:photosystem II stability/assembly factor-like uncharacterized protein|nr:MAG: hypothetical protein CVU43_17580 [Chloroflexi bacterium HGW-Chloroflexi-5]
MKKLYILLLLFALSPAPFAIAQDYGWQDISANIPQNNEFPPDLSDLFFVSDDEGWITSSSHAEIYHTTDGGKTFEIQTTLYTCNAIHMLSENIGYAGGASGFIYKTTDGGVNWNFLGTMVATLADISFPPNGDTGYACGINGNIWSISNTGVTKMNSGVPDTQTGISFPVHSSEGWVCGGSIIRHYIHETWTAADQDYPSGGYNAIYMVDSLNGWIVGDGGIIAHTSDGKNWFEQTYTSTKTLFDVFFLNTQEGWTIGSGGTIVQTTNGGNTWNIVGAGLTTNSLTGVNFTSSTNGYVVGNGKTLLKYGELLGIGDEQQQNNYGIEVWPNPTTGQFKVQSSKFKVEFESLELVDIYGKMLISNNNETMEQWNNGTVKLDISHLPSGIYFIRIYHENQTIVKKIIKL